MIRSLCLALAACAALTTGAQAATLAEIYQQALENDAQLKAARATFKANQETENLSRSALLPQIYATGEHSETDLSQSGSSSFGSVTVPTNGTIETETTRWGVNLSQALFDLNAWYSFQSGQFVSQQAEATFAAEQQQLIVRVVEAYFNVLRAIDNLEAAQAEEKAQAQLLEQTKQRFEVGLIAITDVHESQAAYDNATAQVLEFQGLLQVAFQQLEVLTNQPYNRVAPLVENYPISRPDPLDRDQWVDFALDNNYQLKASRFAWEAADENAKAQRAEHLPTVSGNINYSDETQDGSQFGNPVDSQTDGTVWSVSVEMPLFAGGRISASRRQAVQQAMAAKDQLEFTRRSVTQNTRSLHVSVMTHTARVQARKQAITSAESALEATQAGYEVGTRNIVDVLTAQQNLFNSIRNYANARYDYVVDMVRLKQAAGILSPDDINALNNWLNANQQVSLERYL